MTKDSLNRLPMNRGRERHWWRRLGPCRNCGNYSIFVTDSILTQMYLCSWRCDEQYWAPYYQIREDKL